jgi:hypothetical protein
VLSRYDRIIVTGTPPGLLREGNGSLVTSSNVAMVYLREMSIDPPKVDVCLGPYHYDAERAITECAQSFN